MLRNKSRILWIVLIALSFAIGFFILGNRSNIVQSNNNSSNIGTQIMNSDTVPTTLSTTTTAIYYDARIFCPICQEKGLKSSVYEGSSRTTLVYNPTWYDEEGNIQYKDTNTTTTYYSCSKGHEWYETYCMGKTNIYILKETEDEISDMKESERILEDSEYIRFGDEGEGIISLNPPTSMTFGNNIGNLSWEKGYMEFEGNAAESAEIFFEGCLKPIIDKYIESELEKEKPIELILDDPEQIMYMYVTSGEWAKDFRPQWFLKVVDTDMSRCFIDDRLRINLNGKMYWIRLEEN